MLKKFIFSVIAGSMILVVSAANASVILVTQGDQLIGADNVNVNGVLYDARFVEGTCEEVYGSCIQSSFTFTDSPTAFAASEALVNDVFVDGPAGMFDSSPILTLGCDIADRCDALTPYSLSDVGVLVTSGRSGFIESQDFAGFKTVLFTDPDTRTLFNDVYVTWTLSSATPPVEVSAPSILTIFVLALIGLGASRFKKQA
jgi:hypothetical protein